MPPIESVLKGGTFLWLDFGVRTIHMANTIVDMGSREYNVYFRTIR